MFWIYILSLLLIPMMYALYCLYNVIKWVYYVRFVIYGPVAEFSVEKPHWFWGHLLIFKGLNEAGTMQQLEWSQRARNGTYAFIVSLAATLSLGHPSTVKVILKSNEPKGFIPASKTSYTFLVPWLGNGLLTSSGAKWFRSRRLLTPGFHFDVLKPYVNIYNDCVNSLIRNLHEDNTNGRSTDVFSVVSLSTLNIILKCAFSVEEQIQTKGEKAPYVKAVNDIAYMIMERLFNPHLGPDFIYSRTKRGKKFQKLIDFTHNHASQIIQNRRRKLNEGEDPTEFKKYIDFLDILLLAKDEDGNGLSNEEIRDEVETFMFAGHDTTTSGISFILYNLARHDDIQKKAQEEIDRVLAGRSNDDILWDDLNRFNFLTRCIKESLRLHPPVYAVDRELTKPLEIDGKLIPSGTIVEANIFHVHHNSKVWGENHMTYDPDRFLPENISKMDPYAFIPFSAGPRNCIGQVFAMNEMKTTVARILHKFELSVDNSVKVRLKPELVLRTENGIKLFFKPRRI